MLAGIDHAVLAWAQVGACLLRHTVWVTVHVYAHAVSVCISNLVSMKWISIQSNDF